MPLWADARDFADWWLDELRALKPRALCRLERSPDLILGVAREGLRLRQIDGLGLGEQSSLFGMDELQGRLATSGRSRPCIDIRFMPDRFLSRRLAPFRLPKRRALAAAALDLSSSTPLDIAAVVLLLSRGRSATEETRYFVVKRNVLQPLIQAVESAGGVVSSVSLETEQVVVTAEPDGLLPYLKHAKREKLATSLRLAGVSACFLGAVLTFANVQWRLRVGASQLDARIAELESEAKVVRSLSDQAKMQMGRVESVHGEKARAVPIVRIWEEMTRIIPDDSWATDLAIKDRKVTFSGFSPSASNLIPLLEASPLFANPTFAGPVSRSPGTPGERFTIEMALEG